MSALKRVFENEGYVVIDKPPGWLSVPGRAGEDDGRPVVGRCLEEELGVRLWPVHRLDFEVSGLIIFAKHANAHRKASQAFETRQVKKNYEALSMWKEDFPQGETLKWESRLLRGKKRAYEKPFGKHAVTLVKLSEKVSLHDRNLALWSLEPLTGRSHQLRYELMKHGVPVWGDTLYGETTPFPVAGAIGLRAVSLKFGKPVEGLPEWLEVEGLLSWMKG